MEIIDKSLLYLPKRKEVNILQMVNQMVKAKEEYSLNEAESAYLVFKWISQNIEINFYDEDLDDPINSYNSGKGNPKSLSSLFNNICTFLKVESDSISGYLKWANKDNEIKNDIDYTWNYIEINGEYYLLDVSMAANMKYSNSDYIFLYFGTEPEIFILLHYPKESKWQLLSEPYTFETFESMACLNPFFYFIGFKTISPNTTKLLGHGKIILTSDILIPRNDIAYSCLTKYGESTYGDFDEYDGTLKNEIEYNLDKDECLLFTISAVPKNSNTFETIAYFDIKYSKNSSLNFESNSLLNSNYNYNNYIE